MLTAFGDGQGRGGGGGRSGRQVGGHYQANEVYSSFSVNAFSWLIKTPPNAPTTAARHSMFVRLLLPLLSSLVDRYSMGQQQKGPATDNAED